MLNRNLSAAAVLCLAAGMAAFGQANQGRSLVFLLPGQGSPGSTVAIYDSVSNNLGLIFNNPGPQGTYRVVAGCRRCGASVAPSRTARSMPRPR